MNIRKSTRNDLDILMHLYENARTFMRSHGNPTQWGTTYPEKDLILSDIESGHSYVCVEYHNLRGRLAQSSSVWRCPSHHFGRNSPRYCFVLSELGFETMWKFKNRHP